MSAPSLASITDFYQKLVVGVADLAVSNNPSIILTTYALGSCLGVTIFDPVSRVGGLLHSMLPTSTIDPTKGIAQPAMFIDTGIPALFRAGYQLRADKHRVQICVVGGAQVMDGSGFFNIGKRNYDTLLALLSQHGLTIRAEQVGGTVSRTVSMNLRTGEVRLKVSGQTEEEVLWKG